jgi:hypothetical protein
VASPSPHNLRELVSPSLGNTKVLHCGHCPALATVSLDLVSTQSGLVPHTPPEMWTVAPCPPRLDGTGASNVLVMCFTT